MFGWELLFNSLLILGGSHRLITTYYKPMPHKICLNFYLYFVRLNFVSGDATPIIFVDELLKDINQMIYSTNKIQHAYLN